jgi:hypothetical protein
MADLENVELPDFRLSSADAGAPEEVAGESRWRERLQREAREDSTQK